MTNYRKPGDCRSPKSRLTNLVVLFDGGASTPDTGNWSYAYGMWDGELALLFRWNGHEAAPLGNPTSHGNPTWTVLPDQLTEQVFRFSETNDGDALEIAHARRKFEAKLLSGLENISEEEQHVRNREAEYEASVAATLFMTKERLMSEWRKVNSLRITDQAA